MGALMTELMENETKESLAILYRDALGELREARAKLAALEGAQPIPMLLFCPVCHRQHIDQTQLEKGWDNPPHRSHECQFCGCIWRPADVATNGVAAITSRGKADNWSAPAPSTQAGGEPDWKKAHRHLDALDRWQARALAAEAEVLRLKEALEKLANWDGGLGQGDMWQVARAALQKAPSNE